MAVLRRVLLPALIAIMVVSQLAVGVVGASGLRADHRRAAALAKEKRAVAAYRARVIPLLTEVFDAVQPLQDVEDAFEHPAPGQYIARDDVLAHSGAKAALATTTTSLDALKAPRTLKGSAQELTTALSSLTTAAAGLAAATTAKADSTGFVGAYEDAYDLLGTAESDWLTAVTALYGSPPTTATPAVSRTGAHGRKAPTHGSYLQQADLICARGEQDLFATGPLKDQASALKRFPARAAIIARLNAQLQKVPSDAAAASYLHRSRVLLTAADSYPRAMVAIAKGYNARDQAAFDRARAQLIAALPGLRDLSRSFKAYGANLCARTFNVDGLLNPKGTSGSGGLST